MGKVAETTPEKRKKKGRPSLSEIQKRNLKQQQQQQQKLQQQDPHSNPKSSSLDSHPNARLTRLKATLKGASSAPEFVSTGDDEDERREKKHKLLHGLNSANSMPPNSAPDWNADGENPEAALKRCRIGAAGGGSDEMEEKASKATDIIDGSLVESGPTTSLPDKNLLVFILDRLQKKDTYGVFSEQVDPEELPDYHGVIEHPMDFGTVRRKLDEGAYASLEQFEKDVFLICSNAMQYNAPDTVFFRQARSMQEMAKKDFGNLRQDSDDSEPQPKVARRGRPPGKNLKKLLGRSSSERVGPEFSSDATLATGGDNGNSSNAYNLRKIPTSDKLQVAEASVRASHGSHNSEAYSSWLSEWENEFPASVLKAVLKYGKKPFAVDENRRETYKLSLASENEPSVLTTLEGELKQLMAVGVQVEHGYSRSLARFAAYLGPRVWKIASKKIDSALPNGLKFGPGWVGENDVSIGQQFLHSGKPKPSSKSIQDDHLSGLLPPNTSGSTSISDRPLPDTEGVVESIKGLNSYNKLISPNSTAGGVRPASHQIQQDPVISPGMNGCSAGFMRNLPPQVGMKLHTAPEGGVFGKSPRQGLSGSPDLNMRSLEPSSPSSKLQIGSLQQPDLALQL